MIVHPSSHRSGPFGFKGFSQLTGDRVAPALARRLDDSWHYFTNISPAGMALIPTVVVGPGGTWTLNQAELRGRYRKRNGHWYRWNGSTESWIPWEALPIHEARLTGHRLELYLERASLPAVVEPCLLASHGAEIGWEADQSAGVHVHNQIDRLAARIARDDDVLTSAQVDRIVALLDPRQPLPRLVPSTPNG